MLIHLRHDKLVKSPPNKNNVTTIKRKENSDMDLITRAC